MTESPDPTTAIVYGRHREERTFPTYEKAEAFAFNELEKGRSVDLLRESDRPKLRPQAPSGLAGRDDYLLGRRQGKMR